MSVFCMSVSNVLCLSVYMSVIDILYVSVLCVIVLCVSVLYVSVLYVSQ